MLVAGLALTGVGVAGMILGGLGLGAWDVLHGGLSNRTGMSFGLAYMLVTGLALLLWWPLRERPHIGTVLNVFVAGVVIDWILRWADPVDSLWLRIFLMAGGILVFALGQGMYLAPDLGAGAREGIMTGLSRRGMSIARARLLIEASVLVVGLALGGSIGVGTIVFTVTIGPLVQWSMKLFRSRPNM